MADLQNDIQRYLRGEMTPQEMHRIEKEALSNPFLSEALEGAQMDAENFSADVAELQTRIAAKTKKAVWFSPLRIAASVIVLAVAGWMVYWSVSAPDTVTPLAQKETAPSAASSAPSDSLLKNAEDPKPDLLSLNSKPAAEKAKEERKATKPVAVEEAEAPAATIAAKDDEAVKGIIAPPVEVAPGRLAQKSDSVSVAANGDAAPERAKKLSAIPADKREISRRGTAASAPSTELAESKSVRDEVPTQGPRPENGEDRYQEYLKKSMHYPTEAATKKTEGTVEVEFTVTGNGKLKDFKVLKSVSDGCDEELVRLIKAGPKWVPEIKDSKKIDGKVRVALKFAL